MYHYVKAKAPMDCPCDKEEEIIELHIYLSKVCQECQKMDQILVLKCHSHSSFIRLKPHTILLGHSICLVLYQDSMCN